MTESHRPEPARNGHSEEAPAANGKARPEEYVFSEFADLPTRHGRFRMKIVQDREERDHVLVIKGDVEGKEDVPVRIHSECLTSEVFHSLRCDCRQQLAAALDHFEAEGVGIMIYLRQEGRGIGLLNKINAYALQDSGYDTVDANTELGFPADGRTYDMAVDLLRMLKVKSVCLMTNNPLKLEALREHDFPVSQRIPLHCESNPFNDPYLKTKKDRMDHLP